MTSPPQRWVEAGEAWIRLDIAAFSGLGAALIWADKQGVEAVNVLPVDDAGVVARQARLFSEPVPKVWRTVGSERVEVEPDPPPKLPEVVRYEINGLEIGRVTDGCLEVGVGQADRELTAAVHASLTPERRLERVAEIVRQHRRPDAPRHPLNQLVPERWLRATLIREPDRIGLSSLDETEPARPRLNLYERGIAVAEGTTPDGGEVVVVCSVGIDPELVPEAADARAARNPDAELWIVVPAGDVHPSTRRLASRLRDPAHIVTVPPDWKR